MKLENQKLFFKCDVSTSNIGTEIVQPPQSATLPSSFKAYNKIKIKVTQIGKAQEITKHYE